MEIRPQYLQHYLHDIAIDQLTADYEAKGYQVSTNDEIEGYHPDLVARKGEEVVVIEVKAGKLTAEKRRQVAVIGDYVRTHKNHRFLVVLATPPTRKKISIPNLEQLLFDYLIDNFPDNLDSLSSRTRITDVSGVVVNELTINKEDRIVAKGSGFVSVELHYGPRDDDALTDDTFPFGFEVYLTHNVKRELYLTDATIIEVDVSQFAE